MDIGNHINVKSQLTYTIIDNRYIRIGIYEKIISKLKY